MAVPLVPIIVGAAVGGATASLTSSIVGPLITPRQRETAHDANAGGVNVVPGIDALFGAYIRGLITPDELAVCAGFNGIGIAAPDDARRAYSAWYPGNPSYAERARTSARAHQGKAHVWQKVLEARYHRPDIGLVLQAYHQGIVGFDAAADSVRIAGGRVEDWAPYIEQYAAVPTIGPLYEARWRGIITPERYDYWLTRLGFSSPESRRIMSAGLKALPPVSDIITFAVREVFSPSVSIPAGYWNEFPDEVLEWAKQQGLGWDTGLRRPVNGVDTDTTPAHWYWAAHWQPISPTQSYEMLHRLRPGRVQRYERMIATPDNPNPRIAPFTMTDVQRWLRISDYPPSVRNQLAAISYAVMRLVDIRAVFKLIPGRRQWAIDQLLDRGYVQEDAEQTVALWAQQNADATQRQARREEDKATAQLVKQARESYRLGVVTREALRSSLTAVGFSSAAIDAVISVEDNAARLAIIRSTIARVRSEIRSGALDFERGVSLLTQAGIGEVQARAEALRAAQSITTRRQVANTALIQRWVSQGIMPAAEGQRRLVNLGWTNPDIALLLAESQGKLAQLLARRNKAAQDSQRGRVKALQSQRREALQLRRQIEADLRRIQPIGSIKKLLQRGVIAERTAISRLTAQGYPPPAVAEYLALWRTEHGNSGQANGTSAATGPAESAGDADSAGPASAG